MSADALRLLLQRAVATRAGNSPRKGFAALGRVSRVTERLANVSIVRLLKNIRRHERVNYNFLLAHRQTSVGRRGNQLLFLLVSPMIIAGEVDFLQVSFNRKL